MDSTFPDSAGSLLPIAELSPTASREDDVPARIFAAETAGAALHALLAGRPAHGIETPTMFIAELLAIGDGGCTGYVAWAGSVTRARTIVALQAPHIGSSAVVALVSGDPERTPVILGVLQELQRGNVEFPSGQVTLSADGRGMTVCAKDRIELRCGASSITLTSGGRIVIAGEALLTRASGVNRIVGGSVQIN